MSASPVDLFLRVPDSVAGSPAQSSRFVRRTAASLLVLALMIAGTFGPLLARMVDNVVLQKRMRGIPKVEVAAPTDYGAHSLLTEMMRTSGKPVVPHPAYHIMLLGMQAIVERLGPTPPRLAPEDATMESLSQAVMANRWPVLATIARKYRDAAIIVSLFWCEALAAMIYLLLRRQLPVTMPWGDPLAIALSWMLMIVAPIIALAPLDGRFYLGYIGLNVLHNPTLLVIKPLAMLWFCWAAYAFPSDALLRTGVNARVICERGSSWLAIFGVALLAMLATFSKPSYTICILPAISACAGWRLLHGRRVRWNLLLAGMILPAVAVLLWQYSWQYNQTAHTLNGKTYRIVFHPLAAVSSWSQFVIYKGMLSVVFPVMVALFYARQTWQSTRMRLAWLVFAVSAAQFYLIAEEGREADGNFTWGAQIALFILFTESVMLILHRDPMFSPVGETPPLKHRLLWRLSFCAVAFVCHVGAGGYYYYHLLTGNRATNFFG